MEQSLRNEITADLLPRVENAFSAIVVATPVDTGRARGSWSINYDGQLYDIVDGEPQRSINHDEFAVRVFITNGTTYIQYLNDGSSPQAEALFVEAALQRFGLPGPVEIIENTAN